MKKIVVTICMLNALQFFGQFRKEMNFRSFLQVRMKKAILDEKLKGPALVEAKIKTIDYGCTKLIEPGFNAIKNGSEIDFTWTSASESNSAEYAIERAEDSVNYETIFLVRAAGLSKNIINYHETDFTPETGIGVYRLKIISSEGEIKYSHGITIKFSENDYYQGLKDAEKKDSVLAEQYGVKDSEVLLVLRDKEGNEVYSKFMMMMQDKQFLAVDLQRRVNPGKYLIVATSNNKIYGKKVFVK